MKMVNIAEAKAQLSELLEQVAGGERVVICKRNQPIAELHSIATRRTTERPLGLAPGSVTMLPAFFEALPEEIVAAFESPAGGDAGRHSSRVADAPHSQYVGSGFSRTAPEPSAGFSPRRRGRSRRSSRKAR